MLNVSLKQHLVLLVLLVGLGLTACATPNPAAGEAPSYPAPTGSPSATSTAEPAGRPTLDDPATISALQTKIADMTAFPVSPTPTATVTPPFGLTPVPTVPLVLPVDGALPDRAVAVHGASLSPANAEVSPDGQLKVSVDTYGVAVYDASDRLLWSMQFTGRLDNYLTNFVEGYIVISVRRDSPLHPVTQFESTSAAWDLQTGQRLLELVGTRLSPDKHGLLCFIAGQPSIWYRSEDRIVKLEVEGYISFLNKPWLPDGREVALVREVARGEELVLFDALTGQETVSSRLPADVHSSDVHVHPDGDILYAIELIPGQDQPHDNRFLAWERDTGQLAYQHFYDSEWYSTWLSHDNSMFAAFQRSETGNYSQLSVFVWDAITGEILYTWDLPDLGDDTWILSGTISWAQNDEELAVTFTYRPSDYSSTIPDLNMFAILAPGQEEPRVQTDLGEYPGGSILWSEDGRHVTSYAQTCTQMCQGQPAIRLYLDAFTGDVLYEKTTWPTPSHDRRVFDLALSPDGTMLATVSWTHVDLWQAQSLSHLTELQLDSVDYAILPALSLEFSPDGRYLAIGGYELSLYDRWTGTDSTLIDLERYSEYIYDVLWLPDGERIAVARETFMQIVSAETGEPLTGKLDGGETVALSPDGSLLATAGNVYTLDTLELAYPLRHYYDWGVSEMAFSPDGRYLAVASATDGWDGLVEIFDASTGDLIRQMVQTRSDATDLAWSEGGEVLFVTYGTIRRDLTYNVSPRIPGYIIAWDPSTGEVVEQLSGHTDTVQGLALSSDGTRLYTGGQDEMIFVWDVSDLP